MNMRLISFLFALAIGLSFGVRDATAWNEASSDIEIRQASDFYEPLSALGHWVEIEPYGRCWYPAYVGSDWRPYADGHWLWSDGGWYWVSDEPWAWACYHYGRWVHHSYYGWVWVPGEEWAPSWVCWREGDGYIGWAPLPPECDFNPYTGFVAVERVVIVPQAFVFVEQRRFCERIRPSVIVVNKTIINKTVNVTKIRRDRNTVINNGPDVEVVQKAAGRKIQRASIRELRQDRPARMDGRSRVEANAPSVLIRPQPPQEIQRDERGERKKHRVPEIIRGTQSDSQPARVVERSPTPTPPVAKQRRQDREQLTSGQFTRPPEHVKREKQKIVSVAPSPQTSATIVQSSGSDASVREHPSHGEGKGLGRERKMADGHPQYSIKTRQ